MTFQRQESKKTKLQWVHRVAETNDLAIVSSCELATLESEEEQYWLARCPQLCWKAYVSIMTRVLLVTCIHNHPTSPWQRRMSSEHCDFVLMCCPSCLLWVRDLYSMGFRFSGEWYYPEMSWYNTEYLHDILSVPNIIESFFPFPKKIKF